MYRRELEDNNKISKIFDKILKFFKELISLLLHFLKIVFYLLKKWFLKIFDKIRLWDANSIKLILPDKKIDLTFDKFSILILYIKANYKLIFSISIVLIFTIFLIECGKDEEVLYDKNEKIESVKKTSNTEIKNSKVDKSQKKTKTSSSNNKAKSIYEQTIEKYDIKNFHFFNHFQRTFHDLNSKHLAAAKKYGIQKPDTDEEVKSNWRLRKIESCDEYKVDKLTYSMPYLVPRAVNLLETIAEDFQDSLDEKGFPEARIILTSVLRTKEDVRRLRKRNANASANSSHMYGTTFDIAYTRFDCEEDIPDKMFKAVLAEVLDRLRKEKKCYIVYEYKQCCFHITTR